jgi:hypothetical protein
MKPTSSSALDKVPGASVASEATDERRTRMDEDFAEGFEWAQVSIERHPEWTPAKLRASAEDLEEVDAPFFEGARRALRVAAADREDNLSTSV